MGVTGSQDGFRFRVSDATSVPLRGYLLRLKLEEGMPQLEDLRPGRRIRLLSPQGEEREVRIVDLSVTGGRPTRRRLERVRELDILIEQSDAELGGSIVGIGWMVQGLSAGARRRAA